MAWGTGLSTVLPPEAGPPMGRSQDFCAPSPAWDGCSATDRIPAQDGLPLEVGVVARGGPSWLWLSHTPSSPVIKVWPAHSSGWQSCV